MDDWERHAPWWIERFTGGADVEYAEQILPLAAAELAGAGRVLDLGCGEGQLGRAAAAGGAQVVVGVDPSRTLLGAALERAGGPTYVQAEASVLPFGDGVFDAITVGLVFEHLDDLDGAAAEIARVLGRGGRCCAFLNHPVLQTPGSGQVDDHTVDPPERYWRLGPYLVERAADEQVERGIRIRFVHRPLSRYVNAFADRGLVVDRMIEPEPPPPYADRWPRLLYVRFRKP